MKKITVFGAAGVTGAEIVRQAAGRGWSVTAVEPSWPVSHQRHHNVTYATADVLKDDLAPLIDGRDAVLSALGLGLAPETVIDPPPLYTEGALRLVRAMRSVSVRRLIVISASFVATFQRGPIWFRASAILALDRVYRQMGDMERILAASDDIDWTAVRPGWLMEGDLTANYTVSDNVIPPNLIRTRHADLAHFMLECVDDDKWVGKTPAIARAEPVARSSPFEILKELF